MASMQELKRKMESITVTGKITKAMQMVAAAKLRKFKNTYADIKEFYTEYYDVVGKIISSARRLKKPQTTSEATLWVLISSSLGLCGAFNNNMNKLLYQNYKPGDKILILGKKSVGYWKTKGLESAFVGIKDLQDGDINFDISMSIGQELFDMYSTLAYKRVVVVYSHFINTLKQEAKQIQILPIDPSIFKVDPKQTSKFIAQIEFEPDDEEVVNGLTPQFMQVVLYGCLVESKVCEYASRQNAMETASNNASDLFNNYLLDYNQMRQASITQEINEIISGSEQ